MLVDEHNLIRQVLAVVLEHHTDFKENFQAGSLAEARRVLGNPENRADLAIVDLPEGSGFTLIEELHRTHPDVPVLVLTTSRVPERRARVLEAETIEVLSVATSADTIIEVVRRLGSG